MDAATSFQDRFMALLDDAMEHGESDAFEAALRSTVTDFFGSLGGEDDVCLHRFNAFAARVRAELLDATPIDEPVSAPAPVEPIKPMLVPCALNEFTPQEFAMLGAIYRVSCILRRKEAFQ